MNGKILVTGGAGYIGSHTCKVLAECGYEPIVFDNLERGHAEFVCCGGLEVGDLRDYGQINSVIKKHSPVAIIHFAALAYVGESMHQPAEYYRNNVVGTLNLLDAMRDSGVKKIVFSSTCATYGIPTILPICENHEQKPINPYGQSKLMVEKILNDYESAYGIKHVILRYFNAAGADPDMEIGEWHEPETHLIPLIIATAMGKRKLAEIFGDDYDTKDGTCIRDYIHVSDLAAAHVLALKYLLNNTDSLIVNLGNGLGVSVKDVISATKRVTGVDFPVRILPRRIGDPPILIADSTYAKSKLGWQPRYESIETQILHAWNWMRKTS